MSSIPSIELFFVSPDGISGTAPHIQSLFDYENDGQKGQITFDGYYNVEDTPPPYNDDEYHWDMCLPQALTLHVRHYTVSIEHEDEMRYGNAKEHVEVLDTYTYTIEVYRRIYYDKYEDNTLQERTESTPMSLLNLFPTYKQTLYFRALEEKSPDAEVTEE